MSVLLSNPQRPQQTAAAGHHAPLGRIGWRSVMGTPKALESAISWCTWSVGSQPACASRTMLLASGCRLSRQAISGCGRSAAPPPADAAAADASAAAAASPPRPEKVCGRASCLTGTSAGGQRRLEGSGWAFRQEHALPGIRSLRAGSGPCMHVVLVRNLSAVKHPTCPGLCAAAHLRAWWPGG